MKNCGKVHRIDITITKSGISVNPTKVEVDRTLNESVEWIANDGEEFVVIFSGRTPFESFHYTNEKPRSSGVVAGANSGHHKYSVAARGMLLDPIIWIKP